MVFEQARSLYAGVGIPLFTVGLVQSIHFAIYDTTRRLLYEVQKPPQPQPLPQHLNTSHPMLEDYRSQDSLTNVAAASGLAGAFLACLTAPLLLVKTKQQTQPHLHFVPAIRETLRGRTWLVGWLVLVRMLLVKPLVESFISCRMSISSVACCSWVPLCSRRSFHCSRSRRRRHPLHHLEA